MTPTASIKAMQTAALFGINLDEDSTFRTEQAASLDNLRREITPGSILHITGPSGAGKSTLLRSLTAQLRHDNTRIIDANRITPDDRPCVDLIPGPLSDALASLAAAGLADARCFVRAPNSLSEGERFRLRLAIALYKARALDPRAVVIIIDEFAATLDRPTARSAARLLRRAISNAANTSLITVTSHDDLDAPLQPDRCVHLSATSAQQRRPRRDTEAARSIITEEGCRDDYKALAHWHYRPGAPAAPVKTLRLRHAALNETIGVLVVAMPTLNARWRRIAWPGRYNASNKRANAKRINNEIRRIARVIIDPRFRGLGLASRLVRAYLRNPLTPCTESAAVMGNCTNFFERAGMTAYHLPSTARQARMTDALEHTGVLPHDLASPTNAWAAATTSPINSKFINRELRRWANASRTDSRHADDITEDLWKRACHSIAGVPVGYAFTSPNE